MKHEKTPGKGLSGKLVALLLALTLVIGCVAGGTVAWLTANGGTVTNTFTFGDIDITLTESKDLDLKVVPGKTIAKDPQVTVLADSEACYLFVKVEEQNWPVVAETRMLDYAIADGWIALDAQEYPGVYYREVTAEDAKKGASYYVLKGDTVNANGVVTVSENLTKEQVGEFKVSAPKLAFTAYAVQQDGIDTAEDAWAKIPTP